MARSAVTDALLGVGAAVTALTGRITDPTAPGLGTWDVGGLAGHLLRALRTPPSYLSQDPAPTVELADAPAYFLAYLEARDRDPSRIDASVAERGSVELPHADAATITAAYTDALRNLEAALDRSPADFIVATRFGGIARDHYLETRIFEVTVHGLDLAHALDVRSWRPPESALRISLDLMTALAVRRGDGARLLGILTGRTWADPGPLLR